jgi:hypothetical protein
MVGDAERRDLFGSKAPGGLGRAEAREVFELEGLVSCRSSDQRWRTKLDLGSGEPSMTTMGPPH